MEEIRGRIVWQSDCQGCERRAVLVDVADAVLWEGRAVPDSYILANLDSSARAGSVRDVMDWAASHRVNVVESLAKRRRWAGRRFHPRQHSPRPPLLER